MEKEKTNNMVFYESWLETIDSFEKAMGPDFAKEMIYALVYLAIRGEIKTENELILGWIKGSCLPNIRSAQERYQKAVEAGKRGGRPKELNYETIHQLKEDGMSIKDIAEEMDLTEESVRCALKRYNKMGQKGQNLDTDKEKERDNDKEKKREKETETERGGSDEPSQAADADVPPASAESKIEVIRLFSKGTSYLNIKKKTGVPDCQIREIIDTWKDNKKIKEYWKHEAEQAKEEERSRRSREKQKIEEDNMIKIVQEHCEEPIDVEEVLRHYHSDSMSEWDYQDLIMFLKESNKKYTRFRDLSNEIQNDKDEAFKSYPG